MDNLRKKGQILGWWLGAAMFFAALGWGNAVLAQGVSFSSPTSLPPTGAAGGVLSGTYPNPAIAAGANLGTPGTLTLTNATGLPLGTGVTGTLLAAQFPALTGDATTSAGSLATVLANTNAARTDLGLNVGGAVKITAGGVVSQAGFADLTGTISATQAGSLTGTANAFMTGGGAGAFPNFVPITGLVLGAGGSAPTAYGGTGACGANQGITALSSAGVATCTTLGANFGNPTATIGTAAVNGVATTAMRSDAAPAFGNLTGPITSAGMATSIASQTGTGTKFVVDNGPTLSPSVNTTGLTVSGYSLTGAATNPLASLSGTFNTSGTPTALDLLITNTASNAGLLAKLRTAAGSYFQVRANNGQIDGFDNDNTGAFLVGHNGGTIIFGSDANGGSGGSQSNGTLNSNGLTLRSVGVYGFAVGANTTTPDTGSSRASLLLTAFGNGTQGDTTGKIVYVHPYTYSQPVAAGTVAMTTPPVTAFEYAVIDPAGTLATLTVTLPACNAAADSHIAAFSSSQIITALTVNAASGSVVDAPASLAVGGGNSYICRGSSTSWYRMS